MDIKSGWLLVFSLHLKFFTMRVQLLILLFITLLTFGCNPNWKTKKKQPEIHFSLNEMKLGAPNELLFYDGEYHLFYQCLKNSIDGELIHWGHAKSKDLVQWKYLPMALHPDSLGAVGSGSVVIDWNNTSGFGIDNSPMLAFYTYVDENKENKDYRSQLIYFAFSNDNGITWETNVENPIIFDGCNYTIKDTKVIWHEETQRWVMLILSGYQVLFYSSVDLINWEYVSEFGEVIDEKKGEWTHLDFLSVGINGSSEKKWVIFISGDTGSPNDGSGTQYFVGDFNGYDFTPLNYKPKWIDNGGDNYAGVGVLNYFDREESCFYLGLISNSRYANLTGNESIPESYTIARKLTLIEKFNDYYLKAKPVKDFEELRNVKKVIANQEYTGELVLETLEFPLEINLLFDVNNRKYLDFAEIFGIEMTNNQGEKLIIGYHNYKRYFFIRHVKEKDGKLEKVISTDYAFYAIDQPIIDLKLFVDHSSVELFAVDGFITMTKKYFSSTGFDQIKLFAERGNITLKEGNLIELENIW